MQDKYLKISDLNDYIKSVFDENPYLKKFIFEEKSLILRIIQEGIYILL